MLLPRFCCYLSLFSMLKENILDSCFTQAFVESLNFEIKILPPQSRKCWLKSQWHLRSECFLFAAKWMLSIFFITTYEMLNQTFNKSWVNDEIDKRESTIYLYITKIQICFFFLFSVFFNTKTVFPFERGFSSLIKFRPSIFFVYQTTSNIVLEL